MPPKGAKPMPELSEDPVVASAPSVAAQMATFFDSLGTLCQRQAAALRAIDHTTDYTGTKKKRGRPKKEKDPNAPKWAQTGYQLFLADGRKNADRDHPGLRGKTLLSRLAAEWKTLEEAQREEYTARAAAGRERFRHEMEEYKKTNHVGPGAEAGEEDGGEDEDDEAALGEEEEEEEGDIIEASASAPPDGQAPEPAAAEAPAAAEEPLAAEEPTAATPAEVTPAEAAPAEAKEAEEPAPAPAAEKKKKKRKKEAAADDAAAERDEATTTTTKKKRKKSATPSSEGGAPESAEDSKKKKKKKKKKSTAEGATDA